MSHNPSVSQARAFVFETEFTPNGDVVGGPARAYLSRAEAEQLAHEARQEAERAAIKSAEARGASTIDRIAGQLAPVPPRLEAIAEQLRREAAELAMIAARKIAGHALDANGIESAAQAIEAAVRLLKKGPSIVVSASPDAQPAIERRLGGISRPHNAGPITFEPDARAKPGDWRVEWAEGAVGFSRDDVEAAIAAIIEQRLEDPIESQLDLFAAA